MDQYSLEIVWPTPSDSVQADVVAFWVREGALTRPQAVERASQLLAVCRDSSGSVVAVSTAILSQVAQLGLRMFFFRAFVGRANRVRGIRSSGLVHRLLRTSFDALNERFQQGIDRDARGLYFEIENRSVQRHRNQLVWSDLGANIVFIGTLPNGHHARVWYFDNARLDQESGKS